MKPSRIWTFKKHPRLTAILAMVVAIAASPLRAQNDDALGEDLYQIFEAKEYDVERFGPAKWLDDGSAYTLLEPSADSEDAKDIVRYATASAERKVLVSASQLVPPGESEPLEIEGYAWSPDHSRLLVYTNTRRVWRRNTRGDYWILTLATGGLRKLGGDAAASTLMFAKLSPAGDRVAYVRENNLYVEDVATGTIVALTHDGSPTRINGTGDWVYEEELSIRDAFRWSPDGRRIAYWQFDDTGVGSFTLTDGSETLYPTLTTFPYPKTGTTNPAVRAGVVAATGGESHWLKVPGDSRNQYIARMEWAEDSETLVLQLLNRTQNQNDVLLADAATGEVRRVYRDTSDTWLDVVDEIQWLQGGKAFLWLSEKGAWRHVYRISRDGTSEQLLSDFAADVIRVVGVDERTGGLYFLASPEDATARYLYRVALDGSSGPQRVSPKSLPGTHGYDLSPDGSWAFHTWSSFDEPPTTALISLPEHRQLRVLADNAALKVKAEALLAQPVEFFRLDIGDGVSLDASMLRPSSFQAGEKYPLLVYVYGEPAGQTVLNRWGGSRALFHRALAKAGYLVASFDNRGTPAPKGVAWRKMVYGTVGDLSSRDQAAAVRAFTHKRPYVDTERMAIWGWSGGGSNTLNLMFRFPGLYQVGVSVAPVPDQRLYDTIYQERYMGVPDENPEGYALGSPIYFAEGLEGHLLLIHGSGDDNVHYQGTERLVNRLVELDKPFDLMVYPNRTHAIKEGPGTSLHVHKLIARYLRQHL